jgi:hypothetical protein
VRFAPQGNAVKDFSRQNWPCQGLRNMKKARFPRRPLITSQLERNLAYVVAHEAIKDFKEE